MTLHPDFKEFIESLNKNEVEYLLVGGYAVVIYGYVKATGDKLDLLVMIYSQDFSISLIKATNAQTNTNHQQPLFVKISVFVAK